MPLIYLYGVPKGIRTPVAAVKGQCPRPLDDGDYAKIWFVKPQITKQLLIRTTLLLPPP